MIHGNITCTSVNRHKTSWDTKHEQTPPSYGHKQAVQVEDHTHNQIICLVLLFDVRKTLQMIVITVNNNEKVL